MHHRTGLLLLVLSAAICAPAARGQEVLGGAKPVPRVQVIPEPYGQASIQLLGEEFSRYHFGGELLRPFLYPLRGPSGRSHTRMGHPHDPNGHSHHNSVWISHHDVNGIDFWGDHGGGRIVHRRVIEYADGDSTAAIAVANDWLDPEGRTLLHELRRMEFRMAAEGEWLLVLDLQLKPAAGEVTFGKTPFGLLGVRLAKTIGVRDGGGAIRDSEGRRDEAEVFWQRAKWVDYSGPLTSEAAGGVLLMDHPANPNHPSHFHVRNDGWMGASFSFEEPYVLAAGQSLRLRYGLWVHGGAPETAALENIHATFAKEPLVELVEKK